ncbi:MAG TPA: hypothetical protein VI319_17040 [Burkholderiales bacterium]
MSLPAVPVVRKPGLAPLGLDQQPLFDLGMRAVRAYASEVWTDHNVHDPGVTTLELLCYALTDLCYRACYPVEDLLALERGNRANMAGQFYTVRQALPNAPLTELDTRKLLIDVDGVRNAWILAADADPIYVDPVAGELLAADPGTPDIRTVHLRGLYRALIELQNPDAAPADRARVVAAAGAALQSHRNLCQDFTGVDVVDTQAFLLCAEIEIEPQADPSETYARILVAVQEHLAPGVPRRTRDEMLARPLPDGGARGDPDLYEGPALAGGFIDDDELAAAELRVTIRLSDVIALVMDVEGVRAVREIVLRPADPDEAEATKDDSKWEVRVDPGRRSVLDAEHSRLVLYKSGMPLPRGADVMTRYQALKDQAEARFQPRAMGDPAIPLGRWRAAADYASVQRDFPDVYGIGDAALPPDAGPERRAQALQLEGYLLFFDQWLANAFAQLGGVRDLFSRDPEVVRTYFAQPVAGMDALYRPGAGGVELESAADAIARRNRFLDHLVARFAERLPDDLQVQAALFGATPAAIARAKCAFLADVPRLCADRGRAFDYTVDPASSAHAANVSGLEKRLAHLLGLGSLAREIYQEQDTDGIDEYRWRVRRRFADGVLLSAEAHYATPDLADAAMAAAIAAAARASGYQRRQTGPGRFYFNVVDAAGHVIGRRIEYFATAAARDTAIDELIDLVGQDQGERMILVENILLRPRPGAAGTFLPICAEPACAGGCPGDDPYSYRLHVVLPALAPRFRNMEFRRYAEEVIREETPAHLLAKICWVGDDDMKKVEAAWGAWQAVLAGTDATGAAAKLAALRDALFGAKNVYPPSTLADCAAPEKFVLGRSALGSEPPAPA